MIFILFFSIPASVAQADNLKFNGGSVKMPAKPGEPREESVSLPWGDAIQKSYEARDSKTGIIHLFATFTFTNQVKILNESGLQKVQRFFLKNRGCVATTLKEIILSDSDGRIWPQIAFEGVCEAPERFQIAVLIANERLFWFQVYREGIESLNSKKVLLDEALSSFVAGFIIQIR